MNPVPLPPASPRGAPKLRGPLLLLAVGAGVLLVGCSSISSQRRVESEEDAALEQRAQGRAHYAAAILAESEGRQAEALQHFRMAAEADPLDETLVLQVVGRLLQARESATALEMLTRCSGAPRAPASYFAWSALAHMQRGELAAAIEDNRTALQRDPALLLAYQNLVAIHTEKRESTAALHVIREAAAQTTGDPGYYVEVAELFLGYSRMHPDQAEGLKAPLRQCLDRAAALGPKELLVIHRLAEGYKRLGEWKEAEALYRRLLASSNAAPFARENLLDLYLRTDNHRDASELLRQVIREQPGNERATYVLGAIALQENRLEEAEELLSKAITLNPGLEPAYYDLAAVRLSRGQAEPALAVLDRARDKFARSFLLEFYSGLAHMRAKNYEAATRCFAEAEVVASTTQPERLNPIFYFQYGAACERRGDRSQAERFFRKSLELSPDFAEALNYLGYMWAEHGENLAEARRMIERAVELEPENAAFLDSLGWVLFQQGLHREALGWLQKAVDKSEEPDATLLEHVGDAQRALGDLEAAGRAWRRSLEVEDREVVRQKLKSLEPAQPSPPAP